MARSLIRCKPLTQVFRWSNEDEKKMQVQFARLCVLFEDFMLEYAGARTDEIKELDRSEVMLRKMYFLRRTLATLTEMENAINVLNGNGAFKLFKRSLPAAVAKVIDDAVAFFVHRHEFLKRWRNDLGGHFHDVAATFALEEMHPSSVGTIELYEEGEMHNVKMPFTFELLSVALVKHKPSDQNAMDFLTGAFRFVNDASGHVAQVVHTLVQNHLWRRFG